MAKKISKHVETLSDFMKWLEQFNDGQYLFRGVSKDTHKIEASAYRRLPEADRNNPNKLLKITQALIDKARLLGHDHKDGRYFSDLELLAELQHFGAATCLIDFTRNALIALWFACQTSSSGAANGKVVAVRADDPVRFKTIIPEMVAENKIDCFFEKDDRGQSLLYQWQPKQQNNRVIAQQSVFIFGGSQIEEAAECIIQKSGKSEILRALESSASIMEASIYPDFDGFARQHAQNKPYIEPDVQGYLQSGISAQMENKLDDAITYYDKVISLDPENANVYNNRGNAYADKSDFGSAIADYSKAIDLDPEDASAYNNRGIAYRYTGDFGAAIEDYSKAIDLDPEITQAYNNRGVAYRYTGDFDAAITNFNKAIDLNPKGAGTYCNRGEAWLHLREWQKAKADLTAAKDMDFDIIASFQNDYKSVEDFEKKNEVTIPEDIAALLRRA